jgi:hypothetical protein
VDRSVAQSLEDVRLRYITSVLGADSPKDLPVDSGTAVRALWVGFVGDALPAREAPEAPRSRIANGLVVKNEGVKRNSWALKWQAIRSRSRLRSSGPLFTMDGEWATSPISSGHLASRRTSGTCGYRSTWPKQYSARDRGSTWRLGSQQDGRDPVHRSQKVDPGRMRVCRPTESSMSTDGIWQPIRSGKSSRSPQHSPPRPQSAF